MKLNVICETCLFYVAGTCRVTSPSVTASDGIADEAPRGTEASTMAHTYRFGWPAVKPDDGCGMWTPIGIDFQALRVAQIADTMARLGMPVPK